MALEDVTREGIRRAIDEFEQIGREAMLKEYLGGRSRYWYIDGKYDLKLICRAAHELQGLGKLPPGDDSFSTDDARRHMSVLRLSVDYLK